MDTLIVLDKDQNTQIITFLKSIVNLHTHDSSDSLYSLYQRINFNQYYIFD